MILAPFLCLVVIVHDADTWRCDNGAWVRIAGVDGPDFLNAPACRMHRASVCDNAAAAKARDIVAGMILHQTLICTPVGRSYKRIVARCSVEGVDLSCAVIAAGGGQRWDAYWRKYHMPPC
jgi:endonuclease YncB( thermonuclease family)